MKREDPPHPTVLELEPDDRRRWSGRLVWLLPLAFVLHWALDRSPMLVESVYTPVYRSLATIASRVTATVPISCAELLLPTLGFGLIAYTAWRVHGLRRGRWGWRHVLGRDGLRLLTALGMLYLTFLAIWGANYHREAFSNIAALPTSNDHSSLLRPLCEELIEQTNSLRDNLDEDSDGVAVLGGSLDETLSRASLGYNVAGRRYPTLAGSYGRPKGALFSPLLSWLGISGIYFPFTVEPHVNTTLPAPFIPFTACHELAHQRGFAREDEANFIGYLTCTLHPDPVFRYSGTLTAALYAIRALNDAAVQTQLLAQLNAGVQRDLTAQERWRAKYESLASEVSSHVNDAYLRANGQVDGIRSYGRMVDLMLAEWSERNR